MTRAKERLQYQLALELLEELVRAGLLTTQEGEYAKQMIEVKYCLRDIKKRAFQSADERVWKGLFQIKLAEYAAVLSDLSKMPDTVWQIELVPLLRVAVHLRSRQTELL